MKTAKKPRKKQKPKKLTKTQAKLIKLSKLKRREDAVDVILISFSGGRSSGMMGRLLKFNERYKDKKIVSIVANTGKEREETLEFVRDCDEIFGWDTVWVEAVITQKRGVGPKFKVVNFETATRMHQHGPFDDFIQKMDIPNLCKPGGCTRDLKIVPMTKYMRSIGYTPKDYVSAIGIRGNEPQRLTFDVDKIYPLADFNINELATRQFWKQQAFDLQLQDYQGNCTICYQKDYRKNMQHMHDLIAEGREEEVQWWIDKEESSPRDFLFTRGHKKLRDLRTQVLAGDFEEMRDRFHDRDIMAEPLAYDPTIFQSKLELLTQVH